MSRKSPALPLIGTALTLGMTISGCSGPQSAVQALPKKPAEATEALAVTKDNLDALSGKQTKPLAAIGQMFKQAPAAVQITGVGYSQISAQPGKTLNERRLMAMRAARLDAMRDLTEQIHGLQLSSDTTIRDSVIRSDSLRGVVDGEIRGAKTLRIIPKGSDSFQVIMALEPDTVSYILRAARGQV
ncbi:LPP20 family lipoprotein [Thalassovita aquimarina]|uniref:LPP20 family lipoprotein n=1 Tax=Thalassovita aquimarina TaxID=2785917 RepID=A0ABS5HL67_9RHOB|nr:LPP20 family lipoprotein [Thalassovita aquimarina]MBR9649673.1 LPP20 family lipoprotein [Thalassovita aquimarina]